MSEDAARTTSAAIADKAAMEAEVARLRAAVKVPLDPSSLSQK